MTKQEGDNGDQIVGNEPVSAEVIAILARMGLGDCIHPEDTPSYGDHHQDVYTGSLNALNEARSRVNVSDPRQGPIINRPKP